MTKLLIATDSFLPRWDGVASFLNIVIPHLAEKYSITVLAPDFGEFEGYKDVQVIKFPVTKRKIADYVPAKPSLEKIRAEVGKADLVWTQTLGPIGLLTIFQAHRQQKPVIAYSHSIEWELFSRSIKTNIVLRKLLNMVIKKGVKFFYNRCSLLLVPSEEVAHILSRAGVRTQKRIIRLGVDTKHFQPPENKAEAKKNLGIAAERVVIGFMGRMGREKNVATLYRAFVRLRAKHPNVMLLLVGQDMAGITQAYEGKEGVMVVGTTNNVLPYLQAMDVYVLPSLTETTSLSALEAMATAVPVVSTPVGFVKAYVQEGVNGYFFSKKNDFALSKKLERLLADAALRKRIGLKGRATVEQEFSWEKTIRDIRDVMAVFHS